MAAADTSGPRATEEAPDAEAYARTRDLVLRFGWQATAYQILNPGFLLWFSRRAPAVVGYVRWSGRRVVAGAPVCADGQLAEVAEEFERDAAGAGERVVYFGAEARLASVYRPSRAHAMVLLGAQPSWRPAHWVSVVQGHASLRAQLHRARNKGVTIQHWTSDTAEGHPALRRCLTEWLGTRTLPPLHFLIEPETLGRLRDRKVFVAMRDGKPAGFLVASPIPGRQGWLTEQFVRGDSAPNGTAESMIDAAVRWMADHGAQYVTLGLAPLADHETGTLAGQAPWLRALFHWTRAHGRRFYNFDGLDAFKTKFHPERWEPVYAIANEPRFSMTSLHAIAAAFTNGTPFRTVVRGLGRAVRQEVTWLVRREPLSLQAFARPRPWRASR